MQANSIWLYIVPQGMRSLLNYVKTRYGNPLVIITENGKSDYSIKLCRTRLDLEKSQSYFNFLPLFYMFLLGMDDANNSSIPIKDALKDEKRIKYHNDYLTNVLAAIT